MTDDRKTQTITPIGIGPPVIRGPGETLVFICHASEDREVAVRLRNALAQSGIDSFIDMDDIPPDASFVDRINVAVAECTHFLAVISPAASRKKWPRNEIIAITSRVVDQTVSFLPFGLHGYSHSDFRRDFASLAHIPLRVLEPEFPQETGQQLVSDILGLSRKPPLGEKPEIAKKPTGHGLSRAAFALAEWAARGSRRAHSWDPEFSFTELMKQLDLTKDDLEDALSELNGLMKDLSGSAARRIGPAEEFFARFDGIFMDWDPEADARVVAASLVSKGMQMQRAEEVAKQLGFEPRRMNPAIAWLRQSGLLDSRNYAVGDHDYIEYRLIPQAELRRFVKAATLVGSSDDLAVPHSSTTDSPK
jgi:hypothetical protein